MSVLVSRVRKACRLSMRQIYAIAQVCLVDSLLGRDGIDLFILSARSFQWKYVSGFITSRGKCP